MQEVMIIGGIVLGVLGLLLVIVSLFLRDVEAGTIRLVSWQCSAKPSSMPR